jgi:hypothetical protein
MHQQRQPDHHDFDFAQVWRNAQFGRADEIRSWLGRFLTGWKRAKFHERVEPQYHQGKIAA